MMLIVMKMLYLYPMEVYNFELRFSENVSKTSLLRATYFPGTTKPILAAVVLLEHVPLKVNFCFLNLCILK